MNAIITNRMLLYLNRHVRSTCILHNKVLVMYIKAAGKGFSLVYFRLLPPGGEFNDTVANNLQPSISEAAQQLLNQERKQHLHANNRRMNGLFLLKVPASILSAKLIIRVA